MRIYKEDISAKFRHYPIWNNGVLGRAFLKRSTQQEEEQDE